MPGIFGTALLAEAETKLARRKLGSGGPPKRGNGMRVIFGVFPLLAIPVIIYNLMALTFRATDAVPTIGEAIGDPANAVARINMVSDNTVWAITSGDILIILSMAFFFAEILKSTSTRSSTIANHAVSMLVFIVCLIEFLLFPNFATSAFFILMLMCLLDVIAGVVVTIIAARRDFSVDGAGL